MVQVRRFLQLGLVGLILLLAWFLQGAIWDFVTLFIMSFAGETFGLVIGLLLWFAGLAFLAVVTIWVVKRFG